jgi:hypothetical protein
MENEALLKQSSIVDSQLSSLFRILKVLRSIFDYLNLSNYWSFAVVFHHYLSTDSYKNSSLEYFIFPYILNDLQSFQFSVLSLRCNS